MLLRQGQGLRRVVGGRQLLVEGQGPHGEEGGPPLLRLAVPGTRLLRRVSPNLFRPFRVVKVVSSPRLVHLVVLYLAPMGARICVLSSMGV